MGGAMPVAELASVGAACDGRTRLGEVVPGQMSVRQRGDETAAEPRCQA
jgi:hypothetical protein